MRLLALDTSTWWGSVALVDRDAGAPRVVAEMQERVDGSHVEHLLQWVEKLLAEAGWSRTSLDAFVATRGPGSFTGVRVGLGTIRGLGLATGKPCFGVVTLAALAQAHGVSRAPRAPVMDAGRGEFYTARYDATSAPPAEIEAPQVAAVAAVLARESSAGAVVIPGPGTEILTNGNAAEVAETPRFIASAAGCIVASAACIDEDPPPLAPLYLRAPDALLKLKRT